VRFEFSANDFVTVAELWERAPDMVRQEFLVAMTDSNLLLQGELQQQLPRGAGGSGGLAGSVQREEQPLSDTVLGMVYSNLPHAVYVETGTQPHAVGPLGIQALTDWVEAKFGTGGEEATRIAHAIAWKIRRQGTRANPVWQRTFDRMQAALRSRFDSAVRRVVSRLAGGAA